MRVRITVLLCLVAAGLATPAAQAADHPLAWPACCSTGTPTETAVAVGDTVTFATPDFGSHPLVWDFGDFPTTSSGTSQQFAFPTAGSYPFHCQLHSYMVGRIKVGANQKPTVDFTYAPAAPATGETVTFTATANDTDGTISSYRWDLDGNGSFERTTATATTTRAYSSAGTVNVKVEAVDSGHDASDPAAKNVAVTAPPASNPGTGPGNPDTGGSGGNPPGGAGTDEGAGAPGDQSQQPSQEQEVPDRVAPRPGTPRVFRGRLRLTLTEAATLRGAVMRGATRARKLRATLKAGAVSLRITRGLAPGRYRVRFTLTDASGNTSRVFAVRFRVR